MPLEHGLECQQAANTPGKKKQGLIELIGLGHAAQGGRTLHGIHIFHRA